MKIELLAYTPEPEELCALSAATSFREKGASQRKEKMTKDKASEILNKVMSYGHVSVIEHACFTFSIEEVSRAFTHQLVRHRIASYTQQSQRYVEISTDNDSWYVVPPTVDTEEKRKVFAERMRTIAQWYQDSIKEGMSAEDARFYLPNACKTNIVVTMNARELLHFFNLRCCNRAQWEIRDAAVEMLRLAKKAAPAIFAKAGPSCVSKGFCPEGDVKPESCNIVEIRKKFMAM